VIFWEEPHISEAISTQKLNVRVISSGVTVITPELPVGLDINHVNDVLGDLLDDFIATRKDGLIRWYYTPMMLPFSRHLTALCTVYDCMDELANFKFASPALVSLERQLFQVADLVFTGGYSLFEAKRSQHNAIYPFPSSVDRTHFAAALGDIAEPADQAGLPRPRLGFFGVIDERMDLDLLEDIARLRPLWSFVIVGPVVKIDPATLPSLPNIHYLGSKAYGELPAYAAGWNAALMPFAQNDSTRFISPTKTPEYLAAGLPVVSTPVVDVVRLYGQLEAVKVAKGAAAFVEACEGALAMRTAKENTWRSAVDRTLTDLSWDRVSSQMEALIADAINVRRKPKRSHYDYLVVGSGFAGSVMAERLAADLGKRVLIIDRRAHIGGNAYDHLDNAGILVHRYGPHIFHTNSREIVDYLSAFTGWRLYEHRVLAQVGGMQVPVPINRTTLNAIYGMNLATESEAEAFLNTKAEPVDAILTSADVVISKVGRELYETFFRGYTRKQWGLDPSQLDKAVTARVPTRLNDDDRYFTDSFQAMPDKGYTALFEKMLDHPNIEIRLGVEFEEVRTGITFDHLVFTGPIDEYFEHCYGKLPYRSLAFRHETHDREWFQSVAVVNFPSETTSHTRITEYKHLTGQKADKTSISYEFPCADGEPYYPIPRAENQALFKRYEALALVSPNVMFVGRLATYRYYNMDQVIGQALATFRRHKAELRFQNEETAGPGGALEAAE
ncbi:MAG: UDP-galactopyranose mutase, partial [Rhodospirillales bacterium]|nr:UDP-galactopyranose mutase [Rhodospirillales bacterium]